MKHVQHKLCCEVWHIVHVRLVDNVSSAETPRERERERKSERVKTDVNQ